MSSNKNGSLRNAISDPLCTFIIGSCFVNRNSRLYVTCDNRGGIQQIALLNIDQGRLRIKAEQMISMCLSGVSILGGMIRGLVTGTSVGGCVVFVKHER